MTGVGKRVEVTPGGPGDKASSFDIKPGFWEQWRREPGRAPGQHNSLAPLPAYPSPRPRKTAKPEGPRGPGAPVDFPPFFKRMHYSPEMCLCV